MLLTLKGKAHVNKQQKDELLRTMERFNAACNFLSVNIFMNKIFSKYEAQRAYYYRIRDEFCLPAQMTVETLSKVCDIYKRDKKIMCQFKPHGAVFYDHRSLSLRQNAIVSLSTLNGRMKIPISFGNQKDTKYLSTRHGATQLLYQKNEFYLAFTIEVPDNANIKTSRALGVDLGIINLAADSDGNVYSGEECRVIRARYDSLRSRLQKCGTKSAKKHLRNISKKEAYFKRNMNHRISKNLVTLAEGTERAIVLEDLTGIRSRLTVSRALRDNGSRWSFRQLRHFIEYKAIRNGVQIRHVNPRDTSRTCSVCGYSDRGNRKSRNDFRCLRCGHQEHADINAAKVIGARADISQPIVVRPNNAIGSWNDNPTCVYIGSL